jgi:ribosome-associated heat shock protein Hsp15
VKTSEAVASVRLDKWLWAARFFKTRSLATQAIECGRVKLSGERCKPARQVKPGDQLSIRIGELELDVVVIGMLDKRGPATIARTLYEETAQSLATRQAVAADQRLQLNPAATLKGRPTKKDRREIHRFSENLE